MKTKSTCNGFALLVLSMLSWLTGDCCAQATAQQDTNYWHYHELIYKAECALFDKHDVDACFQYYDQAFNNFEFNYAHDLVNAAQLAHYYHRDYMKYLKRAVLFGVRPLHLSSIPVWRKSYITVYKEFISYFRSEKGQAVRQQYLATINQEYLAWTYQFVLREMKYRRSNLGDEYWQSFNPWDEELLTKIKEYGFPGAKLIGVDDSLLYKDLQNEELNFNRLVKLGADSLCLRPKTDVVKVSITGEKTWIKRDDLPKDDCPKLDGSCAQIWFFVYMAHNPCPLKIFEATYDEIAKGNLHPREYAKMIEYAIFSRRECDCEKYGKQVFRIGNTMSHKDFRLGKFFLPDNETDALRKKYWIIPLRVEQAKAQFGIEHGYRFNWGMNNMYSYQ
jgi:hypothetical protein